MKNINLVNKINGMNVQELSIEGLKATRNRVNDLLVMFTNGGVEDAREAAQNKINEIDARIEELEAPVVEEVAEVEVEEVEIRTINGAIKNAKEMTTGEKLSSLIKSYVVKPQEVVQQAPKSEKVVFSAEVLESLKNEVRQAVKSLENAVKDYCNNRITYIDYLEFKKNLGAKRGQLAIYEVQCGVWRSRKRI